MTLTLIQPYFLCTTGSSASLMSKEIDISDRTNFELPNIGLPQRNKLKTLSRFLSDTVMGNRRRTGFGREVRADRKISRKRDLRSRRIGRKLHSCGHSLNRSRKRGLRNRSTGRKLHSHSLNQIGRAHV